MPTPIQKGDHTFLDELHASEEELAERELWANTLNDGSAE
jgi:hypothetical protein